MLPEELDTAEILILPLLFCDFDCLTLIHYSTTDFPSQATFVRNAQPLHFVFDTSELYIIISEARPFQDYTFSAWRQSKESCSVSDIPTSCPELLLTGSRAADGKR